MVNYSRHECGPLESWHQHEFTHPLIGPARGKHFLGEPLELTGMEISVNSLPAGREVPFLHRHQRNEEVYLFLSGRGEFLVDEDVFPVGPGSAVRVPPEAARCWRNTGDGPLHYVVIQAPANSNAPRTTSDGEAVAGTPQWPSATSA